MVKKFSSSYILILEDDLNFISLNYSNPSNKSYSYGFDWFIDDGFDLELLPFIL